MQGKRLTKEFVNRVYDILVREAGAIETDRSRFIYSHIEDTYLCYEWRFQGLFGFGGKYWSERNAISYYSEDANKKREALLIKVNNLLGEIK